MAMFENFPYTDMHNLNLDWIIKIAKDFLDQYTHIQQLIEDGEQSLTDLTESGLDQLQEKADTLENLLQAWYDTHSLDIANQLASALADLNSWYTTHQNYLDNTLATNIAAFNTAADAKGAEVIASIPEDYSALNDLVSKKKSLSYPLFKEITNKSLVDYIVVDQNLHTMTLKAGFQVWTGDASPVIITNQNDFTINLTGGSKIFLANNNGALELYQCTNGAYGAIDLATRNKLLTQIAETNNAKRVAWTPEYKIEQVDTTIGEIKNALSLYMGIVDLANSSEEVTTGMAVTHRWIISEVIPAYSTIESLNYYHRHQNSYDIYLEFWRNTGTNYEKVYSEKLNTADISQAGNYYFQINKQFPYNVYMAFSGQGTANIGVFPYTNAGLFLPTTHNDPTDTLIPVADVTTFPNYAPKITLSIYTTAPSNVLYVGKYERFKTIQAAIDYITDDSATNPYTIYVMPQAKPYGRFTMVRGLNDPVVYTARTRYISIIGMDKEHCVVRNDEGNYTKPCAELLTNGIIKNLKFIMTHDNQDPNAEKGGYCLHIDCGTTGDVGYNMVIEDCDFVDYTAPCLGIGLRPNATLIIRRCTMYTNLPSSYDPHEGYRNTFNYGVMYCHNANDLNAPNQNLIMEDCIGICEYGNKSLALAKTGDYTTGQFTYRLIRNVFWNRSRNAAQYDITTEFTADPMNYGNNIQ